MHIGIFNSGLGIGGAERLIIEEAAAFVERDYEVTIVTNVESGSYYTKIGLPEDVQIYDFSSTNSGGKANSFVSRVQYTIDAVTDMDIDLAISHAFEHELYIAKLLSKGPAYVCQIHGSPFWFPNDAMLLPHRRKFGCEELISSVTGHQQFHNFNEVSLKDRAKGEVGEYIRKNALEASEVNFVTSEQVQKEVSFLYEVDSEVSYGGVSQNWIDQKDSVETFALTDEANSILTISRLEPRKRIDLLLHAFSELRTQRADIGLVIGGVGEEEDNLHSLAADLEIDDVVKFAGYIPEEKLQSYYKSADVFACPGWMSYGLTPLEAYSLGTKIVLSSDAFVKEILADQKGIRIAEPKINDWQQTLSKLIDTTISETNLNVIPTWTRWFQNREQVLEERGLI